MPPGVTMSKLFLTLFIPALTQSLLSQDIVTAVSHSGSVSVSSQSVDYRWSLGGSPRSGLYHYWRQYVDQTTQAQNAIPLNGTSDLQLTVGTFYSPAYGAMAIGWNTFSSSPDLAVYDVTLATETVLSPTLAAHQGASATANTNDSFEFTTDSAVNMTLDVAGAPDALITVVNVLTGEGVFYAFGTASLTAGDLDPGTYRVHTVLNETATDNMQTGGTSNLGANLLYTIVHLTVSPAD